MKIHFERRTAGLSSRSAPHGARRRRIERDPRRYFERWKGCGGKKHGTAWKPKEVRCFLRVQDEAPGRQPIRPKNRTSVLVKDGCRLVPSAPESASRNRHPRFSTLGTRRAFTFFFLNFTRQRKRGKQYELYPRSWKTGSYRYRSAIRYRRNAGRLRSFAPLLNVLHSREFFDASVPAGSFFRAPRPRPRSFFLVSRLTLYTLLVSQPIRSHSWATIRDVCNARVENSNSRII